MYRLPDILQPLDFPDDFHTSSEGLLAIGGNLHPQTLLRAYSKGIFPWFNHDDPILWWHPTPRLVLFPDRIHIAHKMLALIKKQSYRITLNQDFAAIITACAEKRGPRRTDTWLIPELKASFVELHRLGFAQSVEVWDLKDRLVGGMYGLALGKIFFGESMFSHEPNTSKLALIALCKLLEKNHYLLLDCQVSSEHLQTMGAELISRKRFLTILEKGGAGKMKAGLIEIPKCLPST